MVPHSGGAAWPPGPEPQCEWFDPLRHEELRAGPERTLAYYRHTHEAGQRPLLFNGIPHVLVAGGIDVSGVEVIDWRTPPEGQWRDLPAHVLVNLSAEQHMWLGQLGPDDAPRAGGSGGGMIANDLQYRVTRTAAREFEEALARLEETERHRPPEMRALMRAAMESQLEDLREQLTEYDALRTGRIQVLELDSLVQLPEALIRARIAAGLTQKDLAKRLGMREQQVQRYEATRYGGVGLTRLQQVADALGVRIHERVVLPTAAAGAASAPTADRET